MTQAYGTLLKELADVTNLHRAIALLGWDQEVLMAPGSADQRGAVLGTLSVIAHEKATAQRIGDLLKAAEQEDLDNPWDRKNLQMIRRDFNLAKAVPETLVRRVSEAGAKCGAAWSKAKSASDWVLVKDLLDELCRATIEQAEIYGQVLGCGAYDAQLSLFAPGNSQAVIDPLFDLLRAELPPLVKQIAAAQAAWPATNAHFNVDQKILLPALRDLAAALGFDFNRGRLDMSAHPFSSGSRDDTRMNASAVDATINNFFGTIHETGHSIYTQHLPIAYDGQPVGGDRDMSLHESQSLLFEKQIGMSKYFIPFLYRFVADRDPAFSAQGSVEQLQQYLYRVQSSLIRIEADEATYPLHVIFRYDIEKALFAGDIPIADLPSIWNAKVKEYLDIQVPDDRRGCLQDMHWYQGMFGYFPNYTQGALYAAQLFEALCRDVAGVDALIAKGDVAPIVSWLEEKIHSQGQLYDAPTLIERATGAKPDATYFLRHLKNRYLLAQ